MWCIRERCKVSMGRTGCCPARCCAMNSCPSRKQALFWDSYHEPHTPAPLQMLSRRTLKSISSAALNVMLPKWKGRRRAVTNTSKPSASVAHWRQSTGIKEVKDLEPAEVHCLSRLLSATMQRKTPLNSRLFPSTSFSTEQKKRVYRGVNI